MTTLEVEVLASSESADFGELRVVRPVPPASYWLILWEGLPPANSGRIDSVATTTVHGNLEGRSVYAERIPPGRRLDEAWRDHPEDALAIGDYVLTRVGNALRTLHARGLTHGRVTMDRIWLGAHHEVLLIGRERREGLPQQDVVALQDLAREIGWDLPPTAIDEAGLPKLDLSTHSATMPDTGWPGLPVKTPHAPERLVLHIGRTPHSIDEVDLDVGADPTDEPGLLDRFEVTGTSNPAETTVEVTSIEDPDTEDVTAVAARDAVLFAETSRRLEELEERLRRAETTHARGGPRWDLAVAVALGAALSWLLTQWWG
jgi:hypothetical protein